MSTETRPETIRLTDESTKAEYAEALGWTCQSAKRQQYVVEKFTSDPPTNWTRMHRKLNDLLDDWQAAPA